MYKVLIIVQRTDIYIKKKKSPIHLKLKTIEILAKMMNGKPQTSLWFHVLASKSLLTNQQSCYSLVEG